MTKDRYLEYRIQESLVEAEGFDLLTMGRPEGPGCYCFVNNLLRSLIDRLAKSYSYMVIDNEAGMEHLSRRTTRKMDFLFIVSDYSLIGLRSAKRILDLTKELELEVKEARLIINKAPDNAKRFEKELDNIEIPLAGVIPDDGGLFRLSLEGDNIGSLAEDSQALKAANKICESFLV
ncbi:unnamed protein product [marine sediment metagenome]|uniref:CobQ/CobB/MinD/ParA nucleotide binding domain-containing protein n=1 Tax=marine sediment metagenome TaxID=412755 RepID=X0WJ33_9ZZZZ